MTRGKTRAKIRGKMIRRRNDMLSLLFKFLFRLADFWHTCGGGGLASLCIAGVFFFDSVDADRGWVTGSMKTIPYFSTGRNRHEKVTTSQRPVCGHELIVMRMVLE